MVLLTCNSTKVDLSYKKAYLINWGIKELADFEDLIQVINEKTKNMSEQQKNKFFVFINKCLDDMLTKLPSENNQVNTEKSKESINNDI